MARSCSDDVLLLREVAVASPRSLVCSSGDDGVGRFDSRERSSTGSEDTPPEDGIIRRIFGFSYTLRSHLGGNGEDAWAFLCDSPDVDGTGSIVDGGGVSDSRYDGL